MEMRRFCAKEREREREREKADSLTEKRRMRYKSVYEVMACDTWMTKCFFLTRAKRQLISNDSRGRDKTDRKKDGLLSHPQKRKESNSR